MALLVGLSGGIAAYQAGEPLEQSLVSRLQLRSIGPANTSGRIDDIAVAQVSGEPEVVYVATASGGVFKSTNAGISWTPVFDKAGGMMSIGAIAVAPSNPSVVWVGTGEANNRQSSSWGDGVYVSRDAGATWTHAGLKETRHIGRIVVDPTNADVAYVAAVGHLWGPNRERGVFKTVDGGATWQQTLFVDEHTGATDLVIDPADGRTLFAATYQRERKSWGFNGGGPGSGVYRSTDGGDHWTKLTNGLPAGDKGRIALAIADNTLVYALIEANGGQDKSSGNGLYRSTDGGDTWTRLSTSNPRPSYFSQIRIDPNDRNRVYQLGSNRGFLVSSDGGTTFVDTGISGVHGEDHALWVDPRDRNHLIVGGDGGVAISRDRGRTWDFRMNMPIGQFYEIDTDMRTPYTICGGLQDNGEWCTASAVRSRTGISPADAWNIGGGDGFYVKFDPTTPNVVYAESQDGNMARINIVTMERQPIKPRGSYQWNWDTPIVVSAADPRTIYTAANVLFRSRDRGATWQVISPDLTAHVDPNTLDIMGRPNSVYSLSHNDGTSPLGSITSISESPLNAQVLYTGAEDGSINVTRDGGRTWTDVTRSLPDVPRFTYVSSVMASRYSAGRVYATLDGHYTDDYRPYIFVSEDYGHTWRSLAAGLPETSVNRVREHPTNAHLLFLAHEHGVHFSADEGRSWTPLSGVTNLPPVPTDDIAVHTRDDALILGTHGRGLWILDDLGPLELATIPPATRDAVVAPVAPAVELIMHTPQAWFGQGIFLAPNPRYGAAINYWLPAEARSVRVEIRDHGGKLLQELNGRTAAGLNTVRWDFRMGAAAEDAIDPRGTLVAPGRYQAIVRVDDSRQLRTTIEVVADPLQLTR